MGSPALSDLFGRRRLLGAYDGARAGARQLEEERRAASLALLDPDAAAHPADELAADVQAQPRAADAAEHLRVEAVELLEDARQLLGRDAEALVQHAETHHAVGRLRAELDPAAVGGVLDRVLDEVDEDLSHAILVGRDGHGPLRHDDVEG